MSRVSFRALGAGCLLLANGLLSACGESAPTIPISRVATTIALSGGSPTLTWLGESAQPSASVLDQVGDPLPGATVSWSTSAAGVATVSSAGRVIAVADGVATITAASGAAEASLMVTVAQEVDSITVDDPDVTLDEVGDTVTVDWMALDAGGSPVAGATPAWVVSDSTVVSVSADGLVTALAEGNAVITLNLGSLAAQIDVSVTISPLIQARILFTTSRAGGWEVFVMDEDGGNPTNLTNHVADDLHGTARPDGGKIAFTSDRDGNREIYVMDPDGTNPMNLTSDASDDWFPDWSPDGSKIAFTRDDTLHVMDADGGNVTSLDLRGRYPSWAPDGQRIAYTLGTQLWVADADGSDAVNLNRTGWEDIAPAWSIDGGRIAFSSRQGTQGGHDIWVVDPDGGDPIRLTTVAGFGESWPAWRPDGLKVLFSANQTGDAEIWVMDADGSDQIQVTFDPGFDSYPAWIRIPPP